MNQVRRGVHGLGVSVCFRNIRVVRHIGFRYLNALLVRAGNWEKVVFVGDYQYEIAKINDLRGQKRKQSTLDLFCQGKRKSNEAKFILFSTYVL